MYLRISGSFLSLPKLLWFTNCKSANCKKYVVCKSYIRKLQKVYGPQIGNPQIATFAEGPQGRYDNPMPELTLSPQSVNMNSATGMRVTRRVSSKTCYL
jgi:hypothetical protein